MQQGLYQRFLLGDLQITARRIYIDSQGIKCFLIYHISLVKLSEVHVLPIIVGGVQFDAT